MYKLLFLAILLVPFGLFSQTPETMRKKDPELKWLISQLTDDFYLTKQQADSLTADLYYLRIRNRKAGKKRNDLKWVNQADELVSTQLTEDQRREFDRMIRLRPPDRKFWKYDWFR